MNAVAEDDIVRLTESIWLSTVNLLPLRQAARQPAESGGSAGRTLDGIVHITGQYKATVAVQVPHELAAYLAAAMFALGTTPPSRAELSDALGEITAITGGNIKGLLDCECELSLPVVVEGIGYDVRVPRGQVASRVTFECNGLPFVVSVISAEA
jgi:hypothetical protein